MRKFKQLLIGVVTAFALASCSSSGDSGKYTVHFDTNTTMTVSTPKDQSISPNKRCRKPTIFVRQDNPENYQVSGWYKEKDLRNEWNFKTDLVNSNMTLFAKWDKEFKVTYNIGYPGNIQKNINSTKVFNGFKLTEDKTVAQGYQYLGTYTDENFTQEFDYSKPVTSNLDLYIKRSPNIYLSDDQNLCNGTGYLYENLEPALGSPDDNAVLGDVDTYTTKKGEVCTKVNFGYTPKYGDPYVELTLNLDITKSQELKLTFKNLGKSSKMHVYFTAMTDLENSIYSETGQIYTEDFCVSSNIKNNMTEDDPWESIVFDLSSKTKYGYSIWGTAKYIGKIRIQSTYKNVNKDDLSNIMLIKSLEGVSKDIEIKDSDNISNEWAKEYTKAELEAKSASQIQNKGFIFPKNFSEVITPDIHDNVEIKNTTNGLLIHTDNAPTIKERVEKWNKEAGETLYSTSSVLKLNYKLSEPVSLDEYSTFNIKIKNYGYSQSIKSIMIENDQGGAYSFDLSMSARSKDFATYSANLYGMSGIKFNLKSITLTYDAVGVDNLMCIEQIYFSEFKRYDTVGLNFYDKFCLGFNSDSNIDVEFDSNHSSTLFTLKGQQTDTSIVSNSTFNLTTDGFKGLTLNYILPTKDTDDVSTVKIAFLVGNSWTENIVFNINRSEKSWNINSVVADFPSNYKAGIATKVKLTFTGTGRFLISSIGFNSYKWTAPLFKNYEDSLDSTWLTNCKYRYDFVNSCSNFSMDEGEYFSYRLYYAACSRGPHGFKNIPIDELTSGKIKIVYQNPSNMSKINLSLGTDISETGVHDGTTCPFKEYNNQTIKTNMKEYEWATLTVDISSDVRQTQWLGLYIAKFSFTFYGNSINIRTISII